jgi:hypothetical protein
MEKKELTVTSRFCFAFWSPRTLGGARKDAKDDREKKTLREYDLNIGNSAKIRGVLVVDQCETQRKEGPTNPKETYYRF